MVSVTEIVRIRLAGEYAASTAAAMTNSTMTASDPIGRLQDA